MDFIRFSNIDYSRTIYFLLRVNLPKRWIHKTIRDSGSLVSVEFPHLRQIPHTSFSSVKGFFPPSLPPVVIEVFSLLVISSSVLKTLRITLEKSEFLSLSVTIRQRQVALLNSPNPRPWLCSPTDAVSRSPVRELSASFSAHDLNICQMWFRMRSVKVHCQPSTQDNNSKDLTISKE